METCLVTGGAGFIGSWLCESLLSRGYRVICVDSLITGREENVSHLKGRNFVFIRADVSEPMNVEGPVDYLFHLASPASPVDYQNLPIETMMANSLGTLNTLNVARERGARFLLASTSEVYGDPEEHPQGEGYWGRVNPIGPRSCYDESKRFAEALAMAHKNKLGLDIRIARIFNSILADEPVVLFNDTNFHLTDIGEFVDSLEKSGMPAQIKVPAFDPKTCSITLREVSNVIKHPYSGDAFEIKTSYGRKVKVTGDHSVFTRDAKGHPVAIPARKLNVGDYVALPSKLPAVERDFMKVSIGGEIINQCPDIELWGYAVKCESLKDVIKENKSKIYEILAESKRYKYGRQAFFNIYKNRFLDQGLLPLYVAKRLGIDIPHKAVIRSYSGGSRVCVPNEIYIDNDMLWLLGFYLSEGCLIHSEGKNYYMNFSSDDHFIKKAQKIIEKKFSLHTIYVKPDKTRSPAFVVHSKILCFIFNNILKMNDKRIPPWVFQLPLKRLKYFLEGFREGDGTHSGKKLGNELCFETVNERLALDLTYLLLRFGIVASVGEYTTKFKKKYGDREFKFYRVTICELSSFDILEWDKGVKQRLNAKRTNDLVWAKIKEVRKCKSTKYVYDFSVPGAENFISGSGICCHNTYGPRMRRDDGRVIPNFIIQALEGRPITVYGDGKQTRSFCYVSDMVDGLEKLMFTKGLSGEVLNLGNPNEYSIIEVARKIKSLTGSGSKIVFQDLPEDDPARRRPDISKAREIIKWKASMGFDEGLGKSVESFKLG